MHIHSFPLPYVSVLKGCSYFIDFIFVVLLDLWYSVPSRWFTPFCSFDCRLRASSLPVVNALLCLGLFPLLAVCEPVLVSFCRDFQRMTTSDRHDISDQIICGHSAELTPKWSHARPAAQRHKTLKPLKVGSVQRVKCFLRENRADSVCTALWGRLVIKMDPNKLGKLMSTCCQKILPFTSLIVIEFGRQACWTCLHDFSSKARRALLSFIVDVLPARCQIAHQSLRAGNLFLEVTGRCVCSAIICNLRVWLKSFLLPTEHNIKIWTWKPYTTYLTVNKYCAVEELHFFALAIKNFQTPELDRCLMENTYRNIIKEWMTMIIKKNPPGLFLNSFIIQSVHLNS